MSEIKTGDKVVINGLYRGIVTEIADRGLYPYKVKHDVDSPFVGFDNYYGVEELELVTKTTKVKSARTEEQETVYISSCMTGKPEANFPRFYEVEEIMERAGYDVINPARMDDEDGVKERLEDEDDDFNYKDLLKRDLDAVLSRVDKVVVFDDWTNSRGATNEAYVAEVAGVPVQKAVFGEDGELDRLKDVDLPIPFEAKEIVLGARRYDYGHPYENFQRIAAMWNSLMAPKLIDGTKIDVRDVALMMVMLKMAREQNAPKRDNLIDIIGYTYALDESYREMERRGIDKDDFLSDGLSMLRENSVDGAFD